jgi:SAM-dependent methyltransferase
MTSDAANFTGSIPQNYDQGLGPHIFIDYAKDLAERAAERQPGTVLELAAGTGIASRALRDALPADTQLIVSDLNPPMLQVAQSKFEQGENVIFQAVDAMYTGFEDNSFDLIICQFGTMFFPDKVASFAEARRILKPGGMYLFNTWGNMAQNPFSKVAQETSMRVFPADAPPQFYNVPFSYGDPNAVNADLIAGGFQNTNHQVIDLQKQIGDFALFAQGLVMGNPLIEEIRALDGIDEHDVMNTLEADLREAFPHGTMPLRAIVFEAWD